MKWWPWTSRAGSGATHPHPGARIVARRYHVHTPGIVYVGTTMLLSAGAANSQNNLLFWAFGLAVGGLLVSGILSGIALMGVGLERLDADNASAGEPLRIRYRLRNRSRLLSCRAVHVVELPDKSDTTPAADLPAGFADVVPTRGSVAMDGIGAARPRGVVTFRLVRVWSTFPFGIAKKSVTFEEAQTIRIWPQVWELKAGTLTPPPRGGERSRTTPRLATDGAELFALREYQDGDPVRTIAWRPSARSTELLVRQAAESTTARVRVVLRVPESGVEPALLEMAISLAASAFIELERSGVSVAFDAPALGVHIPAGQGRQHVRRLLDELALATLGARPRRPRAESAGHRVVVVHAGPVDAAAREGTHEASGAAQHLSALDVESLRADAGRPAFVPVPLRTWRERVGEWWKGGRA